MLDFREASENFGRQNKNFNHKLTPLVEPDAIW